MSTVAIELKPQTVSPHSICFLTPSWRFAAAQEADEFDLKDRRAPARLTVGWPVRLVVTQMAISELNKAVLRLEIVPPMLLDLRARSAAEFGDAEQTLTLESGNNCLDIRVAKFS